MKNYNSCVFCYNYVNGHCSELNMDTKDIKDIFVCDFYCADFDKIRADIYADIIDMIEHDKHCHVCLGCVYHWCVSCNGNDREKAIIGMLNELLKECDDNGKS